MSEIAATILIPTHNHGDLIEFPIRCALGQTVSNIEVIVIGDEISDAGRACVQSFMATDPRLSLIEFPKDSRHGEIYRHQVITTRAKGKIICYLDDDDLILRSHIELMMKVLEDADFTHPLGVYVNEVGVTGIASGHLNVQEVRARFEKKIRYNYIPLSGVCHTAAFYRTLPFGWRTTPVGTPTDLYMWQQILSQPTCKARTAPYASMVYFPSPARKSWTHEERRKELSSWFEKVFAEDGERFLFSVAMEYLSWWRTVETERNKVLEQEIQSLKLEPLTSDIHADETKLLSQN